MGKSRRLIDDQAEFDHNKDRYPLARDAVRRVLNEADLPDEHLERLEFTFLANGEATYRYWTVRAEESDGGFLPAP